jgi:hypothetical protein
VRALILEKYATRKELLASITETRGADGSRFWYKEGNRHRAGDLPAVEYASGTLCWYKDGKLHRDGDLPAVEYANSPRYWYKDGKLHRDGDLPAVEYASGDRYWYKDGVEYTPKKKQGFLKKSCTLLKSK